MKEETFRMYLAIIFAGLFSLFLLYTVYSFVNGFFGAILLYVILLPLYHFFCRKNIRRRFSAFLVVLVAFFMIIVPLVLLMGIVSSQLVSIVNEPEVLTSLISEVGNFLVENVPSLPEDFFEWQFSNIRSSVTSFFLSVLSGAGTFVVNLFVALFLLYFMLLDDGLMKKVEKWIPFSEKNSRKLVDKLKDVSYSTIFVGGIIALVQGGLLALAFLLFGVDNAFLWGFVAAVLSYLPVIGPPVIWVPAVVFKLLQGDTSAWVGILLFGVVLSNVDNILRPYLGDKISKIHPLITLIGIFVGVPLFGLIGIFLGPLLLAFSIMTIKMFREEYLS